MLAPRRPPYLVRLFLLLTVQALFFRPLLNLHHVPAVGNLAYELSEQQLIDYFSQVGPVKNIRYVQ